MEKAGSNLTAKLKEIEAELICSICQEYFTKAVTLSCSHSFCHECIRSWLNKDHRCPLCRQRTRNIIPTRALDNLVATMKGGQKNLNTKATCQVTNNLLNKPVIANNQETEDEGSIITTSDSSSYSEDEE